MMTTKGRAAISKKTEVVIINVQLKKKKKQPKTTVATDIPTLHRAIVFLITDKICYTNSVEISELKVEDIREMLVATPCSRVIREGG